MSDVSQTSHLVSSPVSHVVSPVSSDTSIISPGSHTSTDREGFGDNFVSSSDDITEDTKMSQVPGPERRRRNRICKDNLELICCVCGDNAFGYNFGVISCESCKAFFRRNATKNKTMECNFKGKCVLDKHSRKFCTKCRLDKCVGVGMKKEWILDDTQLAKRKKIENKKPRSKGTRQKMDQEMYTLKAENTDSLLPCDDEVVDYIEDSLDAMSANNSPLSTHNAVISTQDASVYTPNAPLLSTHNTAVMFSHSLPGNAVTTHNPSVISDHMTMMSSTHNASVLPTMSTSLQGLYGSDILPSSATYQDLRHLEAAKILSLVSTLNTNNIGTPNTSHDLGEDPIPLREEDKLMLDTLYHDYLTILNAPYSEQQACKLNNRPQDTNQLFNMADGFIRRLIKFCKTIADFTTLTQDDQIALFKGGVMSVMLLRGAMELNKDKMAWQFNDDKGDTGILPANMMKQVGNTASSKNILDFQNQITFFMSLHQICRGDKMIMLMLFLIEMFSPDRDDLVDKDKVSSIQDKFSSLLSNYVYSIYPSKTAKTIYPKLLTKLADLRSLAEGVSKTASTLDITSLEPLLTEIFDL